MTTHLTITSRKEAKAQGRTRYFTGKPCAQGHVAERHTTNSTCVLCTQTRAMVWEEANPGRKTARTIASQKRHPDRVKAQQKAVRERTREKRAEAMKAWYAANKDRMRELNRAWVEANRGKLYAKQSARRAKMQQATPAWLTQEHLAQMAKMYDEARALTLSTGVKHHVDHIVPLNGVNVSGFHVPWNLRVVSAAENVRKKNKLLPELIEA